MGSWSGCQPCCILIAMSSRARLQADQPMRIAVVGGAGFVGAHLADALVSKGHEVRIIDNLDAQVHPQGRPPDYLNPDAEFVRQDVREIDGLRRALTNAEAIFYLAGAVGVGDSMYRVRHYSEVNLLGCSNLLDILANSSHSVRKLILASSVTVYGEGKYTCAKHGVVFPSVRPLERVSRREWEPACPAGREKNPCAEILQALPTDENKPLAPQSIYAITKRTQEEMALAVGHAYDLSVTVLRYFNIYGPRQSLSNPYTGVAKIFAQAISSGQAPHIYEDGLQTRDFIHVRDVVEANLLALNNPQADGQIFNIGTGRPCSILELARHLAAKFGRSIWPQPSGQFRVGDVRHCFAEISKARELLGFEPHTLWPQGLENLLPSSSKSEGIPSSSADAEMRQRGLIR